MNQRVLKISFAVIGLFAGALPSTIAFAQDVQGLDSGGEAQRGYAHAGVQLLQTFYLLFANGDHDIQTIGVRPDQPEPNQISIEFADINGDDDFFYHVRHQDVSRTGIFVDSLGTESCDTGECTFPLTRPPGDNVFVLRGFRVQHSGFFPAQGHVKHFGIYEQNGSLVVFFADEDVDDGEGPRSYEVDVQYAWVPRSRFSSLGHTADEDIAGADREQIPTGNAVIRGFDFIYLDGDHHLQELGVTLNGSGLLEAHFNDNNNDDLFDWAVDWGILR